LEGFCNGIGGYFVGISTRFKGKMLILSIILKKCKNTFCSTKILFIFDIRNKQNNNIKLNNKHITNEEVIATSKLLGAHDFISRLPDGYNQNVQERGASLSVGQRQLISFVRAMVINPAVLILDEATSSVDNETEDVIQKAIETMMKGRTSIVIAHRLSTIQHADEIIVLDKGMIVEKGSHKELLDLNGFYKKLYELQFAPNHAAN
jgi:ATP-binding cassette subfamily B protein